MIEQAEKVTTDHLGRDAYLYIRQATISDEVANCNNIQRQFALRDKAIELGWPAERVIVVDGDLGQSGAHLTEREGLQHLLAEVSHGHVGILVALEMSRLSRNCRDWHHMLEICAVGRTLILIANRVYDLAQLNDRLLLGLERPLSATGLQTLDDEERRSSHQEIH